MRDEPFRVTRRASGRVGRVLWCVVGPRGELIHAGLSRWEQDYMMRENNGKGRGWTRVTFERRP